MNITLNINNSISQISNLPSSLMNALRKELSYRIDAGTARYLPNPIHHVKYCIDKKGFFATGLLYRVRKFLKLNNIQYQETEVRTPVTSYVATRQFKPTLKVMPYDSQINALNAVLTHNRGILSLPTGTGKSHIICMMLEALKMRTLIIVPTLELKAQLMQSLKASLTTMTGITIENIDNRSLLEATDYDCLIIDEAHHVAAKTYHKLNKVAWNGISRRYFLTATPFRNNTEETMLFEAIAGKVIYQLSYQSAVDRGYIVPVEAYCYTVPKINIDTNVYAKVYKSLVVENEPRNEIIAQLLTTLMDQDKFTLCLVKEIAHGEALSALTGVPFVNGADEESRKYINEFNKGRIKTLIGTTGVLAEGVDTKPCEYVIIAGLGKAKSNLMQSVGRAVRTYPGKESAKVIIFDDRSHKFTTRHYKEQKKILLEEYGAEVIKLD